MVELTQNVIDYQALTEQVRSNQAGAVVLFLGTVREMTHGRQTLALDYDAFPEMAVAKMQELEAETRDRWTLENVGIVHRLGHLELGEISVAVAVSSPHRQQAFDAGKYVIDRLKETVPIWKKENWADGTTEWVHPGSSEPAPENASVNSVNTASAGNAAGAGSASSSEAWSHSARAAGSGNDSTEPAESGNPSPGDVERPSTSR